MGQDGHGAPSLEGSLCTGTLSTLPQFTLDLWQRALPSHRAWEEISHQPWLSDLLGSL